MLIRTSRRSFLRGTLSSSALVALAPVVPQFLLSASARASEKRGDTMLVVVQMTGGNDALNTLVPYADDAYRKHRPGLGIAGGQVLKVDDYVGLHPSMTGFSKLLDAGRLGIVQGVGYPNPDRSHFQSMDVWHTATREPVDHRATGWLGRGLDAGAARAGNAGATDVPGLHLGGSRLPLALVGEQPRVVSVQSVEGFKLDDGGDAELRRTIERAAAARRDGGDGLVTFLHDSTEAALASSARVQDALVDYKTDVQYPGTTLATRLKTVAQLIDAGLRTRVYYLELDGFDTHANQAAAHAGLLAELSGAVQAFVEDVSQHGHGERVMLMTFSEFGRRLHENASQGTDHGTAGVMFVAGGRVKSGLLSKHPDLTDLDAEGDPKFTTDFRSVYAGVLERWLGVDARAVLGQAFPELRVTA